jgi:hypothetical protein
MSIFFMFQYIVHIHFVEIAKKNLDIRYHFELFIHNDIMHSHNHHISNY